MKLTFETLLVETHDQICEITLNRPRVLNALDPTMRNELTAALSEAERDPDIRAIIITGSGRAFSVGVDLSHAATREVEDETARFWRTNAHNFVREHLRIWDMGKPVIAAVNGYAMGAGCDLALICDITLASEEAVFGEPEIRQISGPVTLVMPSIIGWKKAKELLLTGNSLSAREALEWGLVNHVYPADQLMAEARELASKLVRIDPFTMELNKHAINRTMEFAGFKEAIAYNADLTALGYVYAPAEVRRANKQAIREHGLKAFLNRRDAQF